MDRWQAQHEFWNSFGIPAYDQTTVSDDAEMPYITYNAVSSNLDVPVQVTASVWYYSKSWAEISQKVDEMAATIDSMNPSIPIEGGRLKVRLPKDMAFAQRMGEEDAFVRRIVINVEMEFLTAF